MPEKDAEAAPPDGRTLDTVSWVEPSEPRVAPARTGSAAAATAADEAAATASTGLGRYQLGRELGRGATAVVHEAVDHKLGRKVALKLLQPGASAQLASAARLMEEARALARLEHPNVVSVHDVGIAGEQIFLVMELCPGQSLRRWLETRRPWRDSARGLAAAGRGLMAAHQAGLVHRDFKPDNVIIGDDGAVRVVDFGLALPLEQAGAAGLAGTAAYLSPELIAGGAPGPAADQWAFAVTAYEALFGQRPFRGATLAALAAAAARGAPVPEERRGVPRALERALLRALGPTAQRPSTLDDLLARLAPAPRRPWLVVAALALLAALAVAGVVVLRPRATARCVGLDAALRGRWDGARRAALLRAFAAIDVPGAAAAGERVARELDGWSGRWLAARKAACVAAPREAPTLAALRVSCLDERARALGTVVELLSQGDPAMLDRSATVVAELPGAGDCQQPASLAARTGAPAGAEAGVRLGEVSRQLAAGDALLRAGLGTRARPEAEAALTAARALGWAPLEAEALLLMGRVHDDLGDGRGAEQTLREALLVAERCHHDLVFVRAVSLLAIQLGRRLQRGDEAAHWAGLAEAALGRLGPDSEQVGLVHYSIGLTLFGAGDFAGAAQRYLRALAADLAHFPASHPKISNVLNGLSGALRRLGHADQAFGYLLLARQLGDHFYGPTPRPDAVTTNIARALARRGDLAGARKVLDEATAALHVGSSPERAADVHLARADLESGAGDSDAGLAALERARAVLEAGFGPDHPRLASVLERRGYLEAAQGRSDAAQATFERVLAIREAAEGPDAPGLIGPLGMLATLAGQRGDAVNAEATARRAVNLGERALSSDDVNLVQPMLQLAALLVDSERLTEGEQRAREAMRRLLKVGASPQTASNLVVARYLVGRAALARGADAEAAPLLAEALQQALALPQPPIAVPRLRMALANALWVLPRQRPAAREQVELAIKELATMPPTDWGPGVLREARAFLKRP
ncbi:MAG: protein kinase [Deltaproteobacteria bacterium]|nr:protein kinase [Deltaproteobacteria bacterium]